MRNIHELINYNKDLKRIVLGLIFVAGSIVCSIGNAGYSITTQDPETSEVYKFVSDQLDAKARPTFVNIGTRSGSISRFDYDSDGLWDEEIIESKKFVITRSEIEQNLARKIIVRTVEGLDSTEMTFFLSPTGRHYDLWSLKHTKNDVQFLSTTPDCDKTDQSGKPDSLVKAVGEVVAASSAKTDEFNNLVDKSCLPEKASDVQRSYAQLFGEQPSSSNKYFKCVERISPSYGTALKESAFLYKQVKAGALVAPIFRCDDQLSDPKKNAEVGPNKVIRFRSGWINNASSQQQIGTVVFHELLHRFGVKDEDEVSKIVRCCESEFDAGKSDCQKKEKEERSPVDPQPPTGGRPFKRDEGARTRDSKTARAEEALSRGKVTDPNVPKSKETPSKKPVIEAIAQPLPKSREKLVAEGRKSSGVIKQSVQEAERIVKAAEPAKRLANAMSLPKAQAQEPQPRTQAATSRQQASERSDSSSITPTSVETKVTGMNANGSPKLQLPNGDTVQSFRAFAVVGVSKFESDSVGSSGSTKSNASFSAPTLSANSGSSHSVRSGGIAAAPSIVAGSGRQASATAEAHGGNTGGGSSSGGGGGGGSSASSGSSFGGSSGSSPRTRTAGRAPSSQGVQEAEPIASSTLQPRSHGIAELQRVRVEKTGDVMKIVTGAQAPRDLLKQTWFEDHLKNEQFRIQIIDKGQKYGSDRPRVLWNLPVLLKENQR